MIQTNKAGISFIRVTDSIFEKLRALVPDGKALRQALQFSTVVKRGTTETHIVNDSLYAVKTACHVITPGHALCGRRDTEYKNTNKEATCGGCIGIARCIVIRDILYPRS